MGGERQAGVRGRRAWPLAAAIVGGFAFVACSVPQNEAAPRDELGRKQVVLDEGDFNRTIAVAVGGAVTVNLRADPGSGLGWTFASIPDASVVQVDPPQFHFASSRTSGPGIEVWRFRAVGPGSVSIDMVYAPTSNPADVRDEFRFILSVT
jgi:predicted secreted protein